MNAIDTALVGKLTGDATLVAATPGGCWQDVAPSATSGTHLIVSLNSSVDARQFNGRAWEEARYLVKAVATTKAAADTAAARVDALLDGGTLTIAGGTCMNVVREQRVSYVEVDGDLRYYHAGGVYLVMVS